MHYGLGTNMACSLQGHKNWVLCLAWSPDAQILASGGMDGSIWLWNPSTGEPMGSCRGEHDLMLAQEDGMYSLCGF